MKSWNDYKNFVKNEDSTAKQDIEEMEELAGIVGIVIMSAGAVFAGKAIIEKRNSLGLSQRELADICGIPQSSVARIETFKTIPKIDTLLKIMQHLGLKLTVSAV